MSFLLLSLAPTQLSLLLSLLSQNNSLQAAFPKVYWTRLTVQATQTSSLLLQLVTLAKTRMHLLTIPKATNAPRVERGQTHSTALCRWARSQAPAVYPAITMAQQLLICEFTIHYACMGWQLLIFYIFLCLSLLLQKWCAWIRDLFNPPW